MKPFLIAAAVLAALALLFWVGSRIKPAPFPAYPEPSGKVDTIPLPEGLPAPVERYYRTIYGERVPVITSAIMTGRATMKPAGPLAFPARFRFTHDAGHGYRHYFEMTFFGLTVMKVNERYVDGKAVMEFPFGITIQGPQTNQGANLGMWAELLGAPAVFLTDPRVEWQPVDHENAMLVVPFENNQERFMVRFDPRTNLIRYMEVMRYRDEKSPNKSLWITVNVAERWQDNVPVEFTGAAVWLEDGRAWATFSTEDTRYNVDISKTIRARGLD